MEPLATTEKDQAQLEFAMKLSLFFGFVMLVIKISAYFLTGSTAILSDAAESVVHIVAVSFAFYSLKLSVKPADESHLFGHAKISFFSSGVEGTMIVLAAFYIIYVAIERWLTGLELQHLDIGTGLTVLAIIINGSLGLYLTRLGKKKNSIILEANGKHVLTDCWTSIGVVIGLALALFTGWLPWDPIFAILTALNILYSGFGLISRSFGGLMDSADTVLQTKLIKILDFETSKHNIGYHHLRHRNLGNIYAIEFHLLFPGKTPVQRAHQIATDIELIIESEIEPSAYVQTHLEAIEDHEEIHINKNRL